MDNLIYKFINQSVRNVDTYQHNGSTWLIFINDNKWVIELTKDNILWYNYSFFKSIFKFFSMDVVENQHYITKWVEDTIQNGVKHTHAQGDNALWLVEDTIQNGVKRTVPESIADSFAIEDTIQNGVKETIELMNELPNRVKKIIKKGVKDTIQNGVKETQFNDNENKSWVEGVIKGGVKETKTPGNGDIVSTVEWMKENNSNSYPKMIDDVNIDNIHEHINSENEQHHLNALIKWVLN